MSGVEVQVVEGVVAVVEGVPVSGALKASTGAARRSSKRYPESAMRRVILAEAGAVGVAGDITCILFFYLIGLKARFRI
ncbi:hypothetical protein [Tunturiibacter gelidiferens]|uniref:hypothetical protein n=1 Tax=Tunturiibacter gelidiferens TaxID=3069689 RepID=UPI003D9BEB4B